MSDYRQILKKPNPDGGPELEKAAYVGLWRGWLTETIASALIRTDETEFSALSDNILLPTGNIVYSEDVSVGGPMGVLKGIGENATMTADDWEEARGLLFEYVAEADNWFNIKNNASGLSSDEMPILTGTGDDIYFLKRALFSYEPDLEYWMLISYEPAFWHREAAITGNANEDIAVTKDLPQIGYYHFDVKVEVSEVDGGLTPVNTAIAQQMTVLTYDDVPAVEQSLVVDTSAAYTPDLISPGKMINTSLQGSGRIYVPNAVKSNRKINVNVTLPNGATQTIGSGYLHLTYIGKLIDV